jgi:hypothetical protein
MAMTRTPRVRVWWRIDDEDPECSTLADDAKNTLNLDLNLHKCALLLPPGHASAPSCFSGMRVSTRGTKVAAPIGDDDFCANFVQLKVQEAMTKIRALQAPQVGMYAAAALVLHAAAQLVKYLAQVVPHLAGGGALRHLGRAGS